MEEIIEDLSDLVRLESPSTDAAAVTRFAEVLIERLRRLGLKPETIPAQGFGHHVRAVWGSGRRQVLVLCHMDTVWPIGEIAKNPVRLEGSKLFGPGVFDMKAGIVFTLWALRAMMDLGGPNPLSPGKRVVLLYTSDEEVGSPTSRGIIQEEARRSEAVLVLEPATPAGAVKLWRKGVAEFKVSVRGRASHAGADPERGISAVRELCEQVLRIYSLADPSRGTTVNVGVISGGSRSNVVAEEATAEVDVRAVTKSELERVVKGMRSLVPVLPGAEVVVCGGVNRPPMERSPGGERLYGLARGIAEELGFDLPADGTGGASDGNFTANLGIPTLDGLGAVGDGSHARTEHVLVDHIPLRTALLARLLEEI
jgi:glutamate carboxypeptidase